MSIQVQLESLNTKSRLVSPSHVDKDGNQYLVGSDNPFPIIGVGELRLYEGRAFATGYMYSFDNPLEAGESLDIAIAFPQDVNPVFTITGLSAGQAEGYLYENASVTGGTSLPILNRNRASTVASQGVALLNPTVNSLGNVILQEILTGGVKKTGAGGEIGGNNIILKGLTTYLFRMTNKDSGGAAADHATEIILTWYE